MSEYSIEHTLTFNTAKRILRFISPDFRVIARDDLKPGSSNLDLRFKTLEVPEGDPLTAAGIIVFYAGILSFRRDPRFKSVFGSIPKNAKDEDVISQVAEEHAECDRLAYEWASEMMLSYFPEVDEEKAKRLVDHRMSYSYWLNYFSR